MTTLNPLKKTKIVSLLTFLIFIFSCNNEENITIDKDPIALETLSPALISSIDFNTKETYTTYNDIIVYDNKNNNSILFKDSIDNFSITDVLKKDTFNYSGISKKKKATAAYKIGTSYYDNDLDRYIEYIPGDMPIIIVAPHANIKNPAGVVDLKDPAALDRGTLALTRLLADLLPKKTRGRRPHIIINHIDPKKMNPVRKEINSSQSAEHPVTLKALNAFHNFIDIAHKKVTNTWAKGHYFELHGNGVEEKKWNMVGLGVSKYYLREIDSELRKRVYHSTIKNLGYKRGVDFIEVLRGETSLGGMLNSRGWKSTPSPEYPEPETKDEIKDKIKFYFAGQNTWRYGSTYGGTIDATHLESYYKFMQEANRSQYANDLADVILEFMKIHYGYNREIAPLKEVAIVPNPDYSNTTVHIETTKDIDEIFVFNARGILSKKLAIRGNQIKINLKPALYFLKIRGSNGEITYRKIRVKE